MRHTLVISKETGLVREEYYDVPPVIKDHVNEVIDGKSTDCFVFYFQSGQRAWYSNRHYQYEFRDGFAI